MMIQRLMGAMFASLLLGLAGCAASNGERGPTAANPAEAPGPRHGGGMMMDEGMCPMAVEGTSVTVEHVEGGAALVFTTTGDVADLRERVRGMAEMHARRHSEGMMGHGGGHGGGMMMPAAEASAEDVPSGARLVLRPADPADLDVLRERVGMHAERMGAGECPMMSAGSGPEAPAPEAEDHDAHHPAGD